MSDYINRRAAIDELVRWGRIPDYNDGEKIVIGGGNRDVIDSAIRTARNHTVQGLQVLDESISFNKRKTWLQRYARLHST